MKDINLLRYQLFCVKAGKVDPEALPPCKSSLVLHIKRANYQACIWRRALLQKPLIPSPNDHGWTIDEQGLSIKWLGSSPAPHEILALINCFCKRVCKVETCCCIQAGLLCTDLCITKCENMLVEGETSIEVANDVVDIDSSDVENDDEIID